jgi:hypothetical protein
MKTILAVLLFLGIAAQAQQIPPGTTGTAPGMTVGQSGTATYAAISGTAVSLSGTITGSQVTGTVAAALTSGIVIAPPQQDYGLGTSVMFGEFITTGTNRMANLPLQPGCANIMAYDYGVPGSALEQCSWSGTTLTISGTFVGIASEYVSAVSPLVRAAVASGSTVNFHIEFENNFPSTYAPAAWAMTNGTFVSGTFATSEHALFSKMLYDAPQANIYVETATPRIDFADANSNANRVLMNNFILSDTTANILPVPIGGLVSKPEDGVWYLAGANGSVHLSGSGNWLAAHAMASAMGYGGNVVVYGNDPLLQNSPGQLSTLLINSGTLDSAYEELKIVSTNTNPANPIAAFWSNNLGAAVFINQNGIDAAGNLYLGSETPGKVYLGNNGSVYVSGNDIANNGMQYLGTGLQSYNGYVELQLLGSSNTAILGNGSSYASAFTVANCPIVDNSGIMVGGTGTFTGNGSGLTNIPATAIGAVRLTGTLASGAATITNPAIYLNHPWVQDYSASITNVGALTVSVSGSTATVNSTQPLDTSTFNLYVIPGL